MPLFAPSRDVNFRASSIFLSSTGLRRVMLRAFSAVYTSQQLGYLHYHYLALTIVSQPSNMAALPRGVC